MGKTQACSYGERKAFAERERFPLLVRRGMNKEASENQKIEEERMFARCSKVIPEGDESCQCAGVEKLREYCEIVVGREHTSKAS